MITFSVIIPVYNRANVINRALDSVLAQTYTVHEIIVINDGSTDQTAQLVAENYPTVKLINQVNQGQSAARNHGISLATGDYIALLDSDDMWLPNKLKLQARALEENPDLGLIATQKYRNVFSWPQTEEKPFKLRKYPFSVFLKRTWLHPSSVVIKKQVLSEVGGFDTTLGAAEDWDLWARIAYRHPVVRIQQRLTSVYEVEDSMSKNRPRQYANDIKVMAKWNPLSPSSLDRDKKISPALYQCRVFSFAFLRGLRLRRYGGAERTYEFLNLLKKDIQLNPVISGALSLFFRVYCGIFRNPASRRRSSSH